VREKERERDRERKSVRDKRRFVSYVARARRKVKSLQQAIGPSLSTDAEVTEISKQTARERERERERVTSK